MTESKKVVHSNALESRMEELTRLLQKNNSQFQKSRPNQEQFCEIMDHNFNCYDQLELIAKQYKQNQ
jgi:hypothetical protein